MSGLPCDTLVPLTNRLTGMAEEHEHIDRPATWENVVMGKAKEALGHVLGDPELVEQGEEQVEDAHDVREEYVEQGNDEK